MECEQPEDCSLCFDAFFLLWPCRCLLYWCGLRPPPHPALPTPPSSPRPLSFLGHKPTLTAELSMADLGKAIKTIEGIDTESFVVQSHALGPIVARFTMVRWSILLSLLRTSLTIHNAAPSAPIPCFVLLPQHRRNLQACPYLPPQPTCTWLSRSYCYLLNVPLPVGCCPANLHRVIAAP